MAFQGTIEQNYHVMLYDIDSVTINCNGESTKLNPIQINEFYIERDYDNDCLPVILLKLTLPDTLYYKINQYYDKTTITMVIKNMIYVSESKTTDSNIFLSAVYSILGVDGTPFTSEQLYKEGKKIEGKSETDISMRDFTKTHTYIIGKKSDLTVTKKVVNAVLTSSNMLNAIAYTLTQAGASNFIMSPPDNNTSYSELVLPPQPLIPQLKYLTQFYGLYKEGAQIFFDIGSGYILRNTHTCTAWRYNEIKTVLITIYDTSISSSMNSGSFLDRAGSMGYVGVTSGMYKIEDLSTTSDQYLGSSGKIINNDGQISSISSGNSDGSGTNILTTVNHNNYYASEVSLRLKELECVLTISTSNVDMRLFAPNKLYKIVSSNTSITKQISGSFRLSAVRTYLVKSGDHYTEISYITLKRTSTTG